MTFKINLFFFSCLIALMGISSLAMAQDAENLELEASLYYHWDDIYDMEVFGDYVFLATGMTGLQVIDISDPEDPQPIASWEHNHFFATDIVLQGQYAYLGESRFGFSIIDISDPFQPIEVSRLTQDLRLYDMAVQGDYLFVTSNYTEDGGLYVFDISDLENPHQVAHRNEIARANRLTLYDDYAYVSFQTSNYQIDSLLVYDISNPADPVYIDAHDFGGSEQEFLPAGDVAYLNVYRALSSDIKILDISDRTRPEVVEFFDFAGETPVRIAMADDRLYICTRGDNSVHNINLYDISEPLNPVQICRMDDIENWGKMWAAENLLYVMTDTLAVYDFSDAEQPIIAGSYSNEGEDVVGVTLVDNYLYTSFGNRDLTILDITDPTHPDSVNSLSRVWIHDAVVVGDRIYADANGGLAIYDCSDPVNPFKISTFYIQGFG